MSEAKNRAIRIVRELLSETASNGRTRAEVERMAAKAQELIEKYQIDEVDLEKKTFNDTLFHFRIDSGLRKVNNGESVILNTIALANSCQVVVNNVGVRKSKENVFYELMGFESDVQLVVSVFLFVMKELDNLYKQEIIPENVHGRVYHNSYMIGAATSIGKRINEEKENRKLEYQNTGNALVVSKLNALAEIKNTEVAKFVSTKFNKLKDINSKSKFNKKGFEQGKLAGNQVDLANKVK